MTRGWKWYLFLGAKFFCFSFLPASAVADDSHYQDYIVGGRAVGLGGAFCSIADDSSGLYYNPAGIVDSRMSSLQISTSLYGFERGSFDLEALTLPIPGVENLDVRFTDLIVVPSSAGGVKTFGKKGPDGTPIEAYAFSVLVPSYRSFAITAPFSSGTAATVDPAFIDTQLSYSRRVVDRTLWAGIGYARKLDANLRLGISGHYVLRSVVDIEKVSSSATVDAIAGNGAESQELFDTANNDIAYINGSLLLSVGLKYITGPWSFGTSFQLPSWQIHSLADLRFSRGKSVPDIDCSGLTQTSDACGEGGVLSGGGVSQYSSYQPDNVISETKYAPNLRLGVSYVLAQKLTLSGDLSYYFPVEYTLVNFDNENEKELLPFNPRVERNGVLNASLGLEYWMIREVSVSAGLFTDFSSAPNIEGTSLSEDRQPHVDLLGLSLVLGYLSDHTSTRFGLLYSSGSGHDVIPVNTINKVLNASQNYQRVNYFQSFFYFFVSSTYRY